MKSRVTLDATTKIPDALLPPGNPELDAWVKKQLPAEELGGGAMLAVLALKLGPKGLFAFLDRKLSKAIAEYSYVGVGSTGVSLNKADPFQGVVPMMLRVQRWWPTLDRERLDLDLIAMIYSEPQHDVARIRPLRLMWSSRGAERGEEVGLSVRLHAEGIWMEDNVGKRSAVFDVCLAKAKGVITGEQNLRVLKKAKTTRVVAGEDNFLYWCSSAKQDGKYVPSDKAAKNHAIVVPRPPWSTRAGRPGGSGWANLTAAVIEVAKERDREILESLRTLIGGSADTVTGGLADALEAALDDGEDQ